MVPFLSSKEEQLPLPEELIVQLISRITNANMKLSARLGYFSSIKFVKIS